MPIITITVHDAAVRAALKKLAESGKNMKPVLQQIGNNLCESTSRRFFTGTDPDGKDWTPLHPKSGLTRKPLLNTGSLRRSISSKVYGNTLVVGTNHLAGKIPGGVAIHQFGGIIRPKRGKFLKFGSKDKPIFAKKVTIPARPFLGLSSTDREMILHEIEGYLLSLPR